MDPATIAMIGQGASLLGGLMSDGEEARPTSQSGFAALPPEVQRAYLEQYLPGVLNQYRNGPTPPPMGRAGIDFGKPEYSYQSQGMNELQSYYDKLRANKSANPAIQNAQNLNAQNGMMGQQGAFGSNNPFGGGGRAGYGPMRTKNPNPYYNQYGGEAWNPGSGAGGSGTFEPDGFGGFARDPFNAFGGNAMGENGMGGMAGNSAQNGGRSGDNMYDTGQMPGFDGVRPIGQIEPLNQMQRDAFGAFTENPMTGRNGVEGYIDPYSRQALSGLSGNVNQQVGDLQSYMNPFENQNLKPFLNPYQDQVIDRTLYRMKQQLDGGKNSILGDTSRLGSLGAFGSSALGTRLSNLENEGLDRTQDFIANQNKANFTQAQGQYTNALLNSMKQRNVDTQFRNDSMVNLLKGGMGAYDQGFGQRRQTLKDLLASGTAVQGQNQQELDLANQAIQAQYPQNRLSNLGAGLGAFPQTSSQSFDYKQQPNMLQKAGMFTGGMAGLFGGNYNSPSGGGMNPNADNSLPWSTGFVGPRSNNIGGY